MKIKLKLTKEEKRGDIGVFIERTNAINPWREWFSCNLLFVTPKTLDNDLLYIHIRNEDSKQTPKHCKRLKEV